MMDATRPTGSPRLRRAASWICLPLLAFAMGCGGGSTTEPDDEFYTLEVASGPLTMETTESKTLTATLRNGSGAVVNGRPVTWSTNKPEVATVANGVVKAIAPGVAQIIATSEGATGSVQVTVSYAAAASLEMSPPTATLKVGATLAITTVVRDANSNVQPDRIVTTWGTNNANVAGVSSQGVVTAVAPGNAWVTGHMSATAVDSTYVTVTP